MNFCLRKLSAYPLLLAGGLYLGAPAKAFSSPEGAPSPAQSDAVLDSNAVPGTPATSQPNTSQLSAGNPSGSLDILPARSFSLKDRFAAATEAFRSEEFLQASELFTSLARDCPHSELQIQCEYFASIAAWNHAPNAEHLKSLEQWLVRAKGFEDGLRAQGRTIHSEAWPQWIETAHLIGVKHAINTGDLQRAELTLRRLTKQLRAELTEGQPQTEPLIQQLETFAWPANGACTPYSWLELGNVLATRQEGLDDAIECFQKVISLVDAASGAAASKPGGEESQVLPAPPNSSPSPPPASSLSQRPEWVPLAESAKLALAKCYVARRRTDEAAPWLAQLEPSRLTPDQQIQLLLLRTKVQSLVPTEADARPIYKSAVEIGLGNALAPSTYSDLISALSAAGFSRETVVVCRRLVDLQPEHPYAREARVRLARHEAEEGNWSEVLAWSESILAGEAAHGVRHYTQFLRGKAFKHLQRPEEAIDAFNQLLREEDIAKNVETAARIELSDMHYQSERWNELSPHLDWLMEQARLVQVQPTWFPTILLRQAELFASKNAWKEAELLVSEVCEKFPEWEKAPEAEYLLARCLVAKAEFDSARELLDRILHRSPNGVSSTLAARAGWMAGETYMMQRKYSEAVVSYQRVLSIPQEPYWHAASAFQIGQCAELCQDSEAAVEWYRKVQTDYADFPFAQSADERLKQLASSSPKQAERIGSGKKR